MITPILLCGGAGTRPRPLSRKSCSRPCAPPVSAKTLFQTAAERRAGEGYGRSPVLANSGVRLIVTEQRAPIGIDPGTIVIEPQSRDTARATLSPKQTDPEALMRIEVQTGSDLGEDDIVRYEDIYARNWRGNWRGKVNR